MFYINRSFKFLTVKYFACVSGNSSAGDESESTRGSLRAIADLSTGTHHLELNTWKDPRSHSTLYYCYFKAPTPLSPLSSSPPASSVILSSDWSAGETKGSQWLRLLQPVHDPTGRCVLFLIIKVVLKTCLNPHQGHKQHRSLCRTAAEPLQTQGFRYSLCPEAQNSSSPIAGKTSLALPHRLHSA